MAKKASIYVCQQCAASSPKWLGRCPDCGAWNSFAEEVRQAGRGDAHAAASAPVAMTGVRADSEQRFPCGIAEFDRVLGGGLVSGSLVLVGGDPGIGKSTLLLQAMDRYSSVFDRVLYVSGEESVAQTRLRAERTGISSDRLYILAETVLENVLLQVERLKPRVVVIDSIQTVYSSGVESAPGSVSQVRECAARIMSVAKQTGVAVFLVGHVTKEGTIAGPRVLEHLVDTVLYFEGKGAHTYRILRAVKNRFGSTNEIGVFEMRDDGLSEVTNPSELFLTERPVGASGSVVVATVEGTRPLLVEIQALVSQSSLALPRRTTIGVDHNRLALLVAVLEKKVGLTLASQDIFLNVAGGVKITEPAADLGMVVAVASSHLDKGVAADTVVFGEIGLAGEVRAVSRPEQRVREAQKLGFRRCVLP
ncbi:MAG TPA: DNA repair protein RadA, partial [Verrucomicrobiae bacterium]|nr:DNA repair protein RadA [Verrucomicrobiae bacterium]